MVETFVEFAYGGYKKLLLRILLMLFVLFIWIAIVNILFNGNPVISFLGGMIIGMLTFLPFGIIRLKRR